MLAAARRPSFCCIQIFSAVVASLWHLLATATAWGVMLAVAQGRLCVCVWAGDKLLLLLLLLGQQQVK